MKRFGLLVIFLMSSITIIFTVRHGAAAQQKTKPNKAATKQSALHTSKGSRLALVIGNSAYSFRPLKNPVNDAIDMASALKESGFTVILKKNADLRTMEEALEEFGNGLKRSGVGLFYYGGHSVQIGGTNYLIPIGARVNRETDAKYAALDIGKVLDEMADANNGFNIVILDACRDNPFSRKFRSASRGLAIISHAPLGTFISYSTSPGQVAMDGEGRNSPYTAALLEYMREPGLTIEQVFKNVRQRLSTSTNGTQIPWELSSLQGEFYFRPASDAPALMTAGVSNEDKQRLQWERQKSDEERGRTTEHYTRIEEKQRIVTAKGRPERPAVSSALSDPVMDMDFVFVEGGCYAMGDAFGDGYDNEKPVHEVCVNNFYMGKHEVTVGQFRTFANDTGYRTDAEKGEGCYTLKGKKWEKDREANWKNPGFNQNDSQPVVCVSYNDAVAFNTWLSDKMNIAHRLPTEAEWEYAARSGGKKEKFSGFSREQELSQYANFCDSNCEFSYKTAGQNDEYKNTSPVGTYRPNGLGLYDMTGNVWEWVSDGYNITYYKQSPRDNPQGHQSGNIRIYRGGSWGNVPRSVRASNRGYNSSSVGSNFVGFRLLRIP